MYDGISPTGPRHTSTIIGKLRCHIIPRGYKESYTVTHYSIHHQIAAFHNDHFTIAIETMHHGSNNVALTQSALV